MIELGARTAQAFATFVLLSGIATFAALVSWIAYLATVL